MSLSHRVPTVYEHPEFAAAGGLMSYSGDLAEAYRAVGVHVGHVLKGDKPGDLPVEQILKVKLMINLKTAKALGIDVCNTLSGVQTIGIDHVRGHGLVPCTCLLSGVKRT